MLKAGADRNVDVVVGAIEPKCLTNMAICKSSAIHQCARICIDLNLIDGNVLFMDGTRLRANASIEHSWTVDKCQKALADLDQRIAELLSACESASRRRAFR